MDGLISVGGSVDCEGSSGLGVSGNNGLSDRGLGTKGGVLGGDKGEILIGDGDGGVAIEVLHCLGYRQQTLLQCQMIWSPVGVPLVIQSAEESR